jgi:hypothetical protein
MGNSFLENRLMAPNTGTSAGRNGTSAPAVVEIALLLPANRVEALVDLSRRRQQSVGQILRGLIDRALLDDE